MLQTPSLSVLDRARPNAGSQRPMRVLLCTIPLDVGLPRGVSNEGAVRLRMTANLPVMPKIAIVSLVKWMERHGYTHDQWDFFDIDMLDPADTDIRAYFKAYNPAVIGFSAVVSTTYGQVKRIAAIAREVCPDAWLVLGGSLSASARVVLNKTAIDVCIQGDGEIPWVEFLDYVKCHGRDWNYEGLETIKGLTYLRTDGEMQFNGYGEKIPASENPYPDYEILKVGLRTAPETFENYFRLGRDSCWFRPDPRTHEPTRRPRIAALWTTKGCVVRCTFCQRSTKGYQTNSVTTLDEHLAELKEKYDVGFVQVIDENFGSDKKHAYEVARAMKKHDMLWISGGIRCVSVNEDDVRFYHEHGCSGLKFGVESGSQKILDLMEKNFTVKHVYDAIRACYAHNVYSPIAVMTGMPGETDQTARDTGEFVGTLARMAGIPPEEMGYVVFYALPLPGTPLYEYSQQVGVIGRSIDAEEKYLLAVSDRAADKGNYININGASLKTLLFWDFLVRYEASRTYYRKPVGADRVSKGLNAGVGSGVMPTEIHGIDHTRLELEKSFPSGGSLIYQSLQAARPSDLLRTILFYLRRGASLLNYRLAASPFIARLPRPVVYITMRNLTYAEFFMNKLVRKIYRLVGRSVEDRSLYGDLKFPRPITDEFVNSFDRRIERSLRHIVKLRREQVPQPMSLTERNNQILVQGL